MFTTSSWTRKSAELTLKYFVRFFRFVPDSLIKSLLIHHPNMNLFDLSKSSVTLADVKCYLQFILIKCTSLGEHLLLLSIDFMYQADNKERSSARKEHMPYPRFTKFIINYFISKDISIFMRNGINLYTVRDDSLLGTLKFVSKTDESQKYGALIPDGMINQDIKDTVAYKTYYDYASGKVAPKKARKYKKIASPSRKLSPILEAEPVKKAKQVKRHAKKTATVPTTGFVIRDTPGVSVLKKKAPAKVTKDKGIDLLSDVALLEVAQLKKALKETGIDKGTGTKPGVPDVPIYNSESENESWGD
ncbi:hypothetical protein Tco_1240338, partial [Tanacetum coccineum]